MNTDCPIPSTSLWIKTFFLSREWKNGAPVHPPQHCNHGLRGSALIVFYRWPTRGRKKMRKPSVSVAVGFQPRAGLETALRPLSLASPPHPSPLCRQLRTVFAQAHRSHCRAHHSAAWEVHGQKARQPPPRGGYAWTVKCTRKQMASVTFLITGLAARVPLCPVSAGNLETVALDCNIFWQRDLTIY